MSKDILDMKRAPVNRTAARVLSPGEEYIPNKKVMAGDADYLEVTALDALQGEARRLAMQWRGHRYGRMTVIGLSATVAHRWVVRCACGVYTLRKLKAIRNPANSWDACEHCRHLMYLKRAEHFRRTGRDLEYSDL